MSAGQGGEGRGGGAGAPATGAPATVDGAAGPRRRRAASVTLRQDGVRASAAQDLMDPANRSLAEALRIAYRLLMVAIVVMLGLYVLSGFQAVKSNERGVQLTFGRITRESLPQGLAFSWPQPVGDIVRVSTAVQRVELTREFFPQLSEQEEKGLAGSEKEQSLAGTGSDSLDPNTDGMLLTADGFIVHTRWAVTYQRLETAQSLRRIADDRDGPAGETTERRIVLAAARRGVVHAAAGLTIDEVLYTPDRVQDAALAAAQRMLEEMDSGLRIQSLNMTAKMPPRRIIPDFNGVQAAQSRAGKEIEEARSRANDTLAAAAGQAAPLLLRLIDQYETALATGEKGRADGALATLRDAMRGQPVTVDGREARPQPSGDVTAKIAEAQSYRTSVVTRAQGDAAAFKAKLAAFKSNPSVFLNSEWTDAFRTFADRDVVQTLMVPRADVLRLSVNPDPTVAREIETARRQREVDENLKRREIMRQRDRFSGRASTEAQNAQER